MTYARMNEETELEPGGSRSVRKLEPPQTGIGGRLRAIRGHLTLEDFAAALGIGKSSVSRYEKGGRSPDAEFLGSVCEQYGVTASWLLLGQGPMRASDAQASAPAGLDLAELAGAIETVEEGLAVTGRTMTAAKKAELVAAVYDLFTTASAPVDKGVILRLVKSAA